MNAAARLRRTMHATGRNYITAVTADAPVSFWVLNDTTTVAVDRVGPNPGTYQGGYSQNQAGYSQFGLVQLDGTSGKISVPANADFEVTAAWSIEAIVYALSTPTGPGILTGSDFTVNSKVMYEMGCGFATPGSSALQVGFYNSAAGGWSLATESATFPLLSLQYCAATWNGTDLKLYRDGTQVAANTPGHTPVSDNTGIQIGHRHDNSGTVNFFPGYMGGVAFYNYALSAAQVTSHHVAAGV